MKKSVLIIVLMLVILVPVLLTAQPLPFDEGIGGGNGAPTGGGAPIGGGLLIMLTLALGYGAKKVVSARRKILD